MANNLASADHSRTTDPNGFEGYYDERGDWRGRCPNCGEDEIDGGRCLYCSHEV